MPFKHPVMDVLFLLSVTFIWLMIVYQIILTFAGNRYRKLVFAEHEKIPKSDDVLEPVSILIPARNESIVIEDTLNTLLNLDYPADKIEIVVINDSSTDDTGERVERIAHRDGRVKLVSLPAAQTGHGKAWALNLGLQEAKHELIAVYDADNLPQTDALRNLVPHLVSSDQTAAVIGKFRTVNAASTWLTRFINIETLAFQWILQAGRYMMSRVSILPGTNYVIRKSVVLQCGGWDEAAITEDSELSVRIYQEGFTIKFVPLSVTWEQEPEDISVWSRQRTRWVRGNNYVLRKFAAAAFSFRSRFLVLEFIYLFALYYLFLVSIVISHLMFIFSGLGVIALDIPGPYFGVWLSAYLLFIFEIVLVLSYEREDSLKNIIYTIIMYFTYCQLWIYIVFRALVLDIRGIRMGVWDKTTRYKLKTMEKK